MDEEDSINNVRKKRAASLSLDNVETRKAPLPFKHREVEAAPSATMLPEVKVPRERSALYKELKKGQQKAFDAIEEFATDRSPWGPKEFLLTGGAGTGKTFLQEAILKDIPVSWCLSATTNKAAKVIQRKIGDLVPCRTIYSVLGMRMSPNEDMLELKKPTRPMDIGKYDIIAVDEASMANKMLTEYLRTQARYQGVKILWIADDAQLNPVGEYESPVFEVKHRARLTKVLRHDNQILTFAQHVRKQVFACPNDSIRIRSDNDGDQGVWKMKTHTWMGQVEAAADEGLFSEVDNTKVIAWRNNTVNLMNRMIRRRIFGSESAKQMWLPGDRISIRSPVIDRESDQVVAHIDDEATISSVVDCRHSRYDMIRTHRIVIQIDNGPSLTIDVVSDRSETTLLDELNRLAREAKNDHRKWKAFWDIRNAFCNIGHSYAQTGHRAQGSTYKNVFLDASEILANPNREEALRGFYVGCTRPSTRLLIT